MDDKVMVAIETVTDIIDFVQWHPEARVMDIMAEFDLTDDEAWFALATARLVIQDIERQN